MGKRLFVGNLSFNTTEDTLSEMFQQNGIATASVQVMLDRDTGRSRGFAFVDLANDADLANAVKALDGKSLYDLMETERVTCAAGRSKAMRPSRSPTMRGKCSSAISTWCSVATSVTLRARASSTSVASA